MGTQLRPEKKGTASTQFFVNVYFVQTAGWMKTPLGTPRRIHIVLDGDPAKGAQHTPLFGSCLL